MEENGHPFCCSLLLFCCAKLMAPFRGNKLGPLQFLVGCTDCGRVCGLLFWLITVSNSRCPWFPRDCQLQSCGPTIAWKPDKNGVIHEVSQEPALKAELATELDLQNALRRRGIAYEAAAAMSFVSHEKLVARLFEELQPRWVLEGDNDPALPCRPRVS